MATYYITQTEDGRWQPWVDPDNDYQYGPLYPQATIDDAIRVAEHEFPGATREEITD